MVAFNKSNIEKMIKDSVREITPDAELSDGTSLGDFYVKPLKLLLESFQAEQQRLDDQRTLLNFASLDSDQMNALSANAFLSRKKEDFAKGTIRVFFETPRNTFIPTSISFSAKNGTTFRPINSVSVTLSQMITNFVDGKYFIDIRVQANVAGINSAIGPDQISGTSNGDIGELYSTNILSFEGGRTEESNTELFNRIGKSLGERSLVRGSAMEGVLMENFDFLRIFIAGYFDRNSFGDVIVKRDLIDHLIGATPVVEHYGGKTDIFIKPYNLISKTADFDLSDRDLFPLSSGLMDLYVEQSNPQPFDYFAFLVSSSSLPVTPLIDIESVCVTQGTFNTSGCATNILDISDYFIISPSTGPSYPTVTLPRPSAPAKTSNANSDPSNLRYSVFESFWIVIKRSAVGGTLPIDPFNENWKVRVNYKTTNMVQDMQTFVDNPSNRTLTDNPIVKHLFPVFLDANIRVSGNNLDLDVLTAILSDAIYNDDVQEVSDLINILYKNGASKVGLPLTVSLRSPRIDAYVDSDAANNPGSYLINFSTQDNLDESAITIPANQPIHIDLSMTHTLMPGLINITLI